MHAACAPAGGTEFLARRFFHEANEALAVELRIHAAKFALDPTYPLVPRLDVLQLGVYLKKRGRRRRRRGGRTGKRQEHAGYGHLQSRVLQLVHSVWAKKKVQEANTNLFAENQQRSKQPSPLWSSILCTCFV